MNEKFTAISYPADFFSEEKKSGGYFLRMTEYNDDVQKFIEKFYMIAQNHGVIIENGLNNPTAAEISECTGFAVGFNTSAEFIRTVLCRSLRLPSETADTLSAAFNTIFEELKKQGKNDNMLKNVFVKFLCWLKMDLRNALYLKKNSFPRVLIKGEPSKHEIYLLWAVSQNGADVLLIAPNGDQGYQKVDESDRFSKQIQISNGGKFPDNYSFSGIRQAIENEQRLMKLTQGTETKFCTNAWISGEILEDIKKEPTTRGGEPDIIYTCYARVNGAEDKMTYMNSLYQTYMSIKSRNVLILDKTIELPSNEEIAKINRGNYRDIFSLISDMSKNIVHSNTQLQEIIKSAFAKIISDYYAVVPEIRKAMTKAVYLLCWFKRYQQELFGGWKPGMVSCLFYLGGCKNDNEAMFIKMIARCPADVLILMPELTKKCELSDELLYERNFTQSLSADKFPRATRDIQIGTVAYYAERELDTIMYQDSGMYRDFQFAKANTVNLQTMYEEIPMLWGEEIKYRPNFSVNSDTVSMPVIMAKISGIKHKDMTRYWNEIRSLITPDTIIIRNSPMITEKFPCEYTVPFIKNGRLQKNEIKHHKLYKYDFLKEEAQDFILDKLAALLEKKIIKQTAANGLDYQIMAIALNMSNEILRLLQKFDFTKSNPKVIYINTTENIISLEDSILLAFLNQLGFDVLFYIPTGYQCAEKYYNSDIVNCHETGEYVFDLQIPDLSRRIDTKVPIFKRLFSKDRK